MPAKKIFWSPARKETVLLRNAVCSDYLTRAATKSGGIFDPSRLAIVNHMLRAVPAGSKLASALRSLLITATSTHVLLDLFVADFKRSSSTFASRNRRWHKIDLNKQHPARI